MFDQVSQSEGQSTTEEALFSLDLLDSKTVKSSSKKESETTGLSALLLDGLSGIIRAARDAQERAAVVNKPKVENAAPLGSAYGLVKALETLKELMPQPWMAGNGNQQELLEYQRTLAGELGKIPKEQLDALASKDINELKKFLKARGFDQLADQLQPFQDDRSVGVVTSLHLQGKWNGEAHAPIVASDGNTYNAFKLRQPEFYKVEGHNQPVIKIFTDPKTGLEVFVTPYTEGAPGLDATAIAQRLTGPQARRDNSDFNAVVLPNVDMNRVARLDWLEGMESQDFIIRQALAQTQIKMDQSGFDVKEAVAIEAAIKSALPPQDNAYVMKDKFMFIVRKPGLSMPLFASVVGHENWKDPSK